MATREFETAETPTSATMRQLSIFLENRVGQLLRLLQLLHGTPVRILGLNIVHATDCAILRLLCDDTDRAKKLLRDENFTLNESEVVVVELPSGSGMLMICAALLSAEINISYVYPLLVQIGGHSAIAIHCDDLATAANVLRHRKLRILTEDELGPGPAR